MSGFQFIPPGNSATSLSQGSPYGGFNQTQEAEIKRILAIELAPLKQSLAKDIKSIQKESLSLIGVFVAAITFVLAGVQVAILDNLIFKERIAVLLILGLILLLFVALFQVVLFHQSFSKNTIKRISWVSIFCFIFSIITLIAILLGQVYLSVSNQNKEYSEKTLKQIKEDLINITTSTTVSSTY